MKRLFCIGIILALAPPALAQSVVETDFTISVPNPAGGDPIVESSTVVPLLDGTCYDWQIRLAKTKSAITITEVYTLPAAPDTWGVPEDGSVVVSDDQLSAISTLTLTPDDGWIWHGWCVTEGDPEGGYSFEIKSGETLLHRFEFELRDM